MSLPSSIAFIASLLSLGMAATALLRHPKGLPQWSFALGMALFAAESFFAGLSFNTVQQEELVHWQNTRIYITGLLPGVWLLFSLSYARGNYRQFVAKWAPLLSIAFILPLLAIVFFRDKLIIGLDRNIPPYDWLLSLRWPGTVLYSSFLIGAILILMHMERTLRISVGTVRWRIKYLIVGLLFLFAVRIYTSSQTLLYLRINLALQQIDAIALLLASALMVLAVLRAGLSKVDVYPSPSLLHSSAAVLLAGVYLLLVGALARFITVLGGDAGFALKIFFVLASLVVLAALVLSERARQHLRNFISRNFQRPQYDYRQVWTTFAERTSFILDKKNLCQAVVRWVSDTFKILSVTFWLVDDVHQRLVLGASTAILQNPDQPLLPLDGESSLLVQELKRSRSPIDMDATKEKWIGILKDAATNHFPNGGRRVCVPVLGRGELVGVLTLGDRVNGLPYTVEDFDLLKCLAEQVSSHLVNIQLSEKLLQVKEMEAVQTMAAFFVHDLKNVGSTLSLMLQNLQVHFANPDFRKDALRSLNTSVTHLNDLIGRLTLLRQKCDLVPAATDLNSLVTSVLENVQSPPGTQVVRSLQSLPNLSLDREQILKVVTNLVLNAFEAVGQSGVVQVQTAQRNGWACLCVQDNGPGISPEFLAHSLFRPFQTTKKKGLGIGLFQCKTIVDAHQGKMEVESLLGKGTIFRVLLPINQPAL